MNSRDRCRSFGDDAELHRILRLFEWDRESLDPAALGRHERDNRARVDAAAQNAPSGTSLIAKPGGLAQPARISSAARLPRSVAGEYFSVNTA
jgi:hypothetical protein